MSDNYFKLSALDPDAEGIGGVNAVGGYCFLQDAVIGIQKESENLGDVLDVAKQSHKLTLESITLSQSSAKVGEPVDITMKVTNNGTNAFDTDLVLVNILDPQNPNNSTAVGGKAYYIPAGKTIDCDFTLTPTTAGTYNLTVATKNTYLNTAMQATLTVTESGVTTTDDIDLTVKTWSVKNWDEEGSKLYFYGNTLTGTITMSNPETDKAYDGNFEWGLFKSAENELLADKAEHITISANGTKEIDFKITDLEANTTYVLAYTHTKNSNWLNWTGIGKLTCKAGIISYDKEGNATVTKPTAAYTVPAEATSVNLTGCGVTTVTKNSNPNCLYILGTDDTVPDGLTNVIKNDGGIYNAESIVLEDSYDFASPVNIWVTNIEFTYRNDRQGDGTNGWNTLVLPFDVAKVTADGTPIDWFHSSSDSGKQFWVKEFTSDESGTVNFGYASEIKSNTPYIVALPGNLSGKTIKFLAENSAVDASSTPASVTGGNYRFVGSTTAVSAENIYCLNDAGSSFDLKTTGDSIPFRAFFKAGTFDHESSFTPAVTTLRIGADNATGISATLNDKGQMKDSPVVYNLAGQRVAQPTKGLYIVNGRKVAIK